MLGNILIVSLAMSAVIILLLIISPLIHKRYGAKWYYFIWLVLALRLVIPFRLELPAALVQIPVPTDQTILFIQDGKFTLSPFAFFSPSMLGPADASLDNTLPDSSVDSASDGASNAASDPASASSLASISPTVPVSGQAPDGYIPVITLQELLLALWALGALSFFLFHLTGYLRFQRKIKRSCNRSSLIEQEILDSALAGMNIKVRPQLLRCPQITGPMLTGFFRRAILLPDLGYTGNELSIVLQHELTHCKRGDIWYKLLLLAANSLHWFNPFVYLMVKAANRDLEYSCDDSVIKNSGLDFRKEYSLTILKAMQNGQTPALCTGFSENGEKARRRFANILDCNHKKKGLWVLALVLTLTVMMSTLVACSSGQAGPGILEVNSGQQQESDPGQLDGYAEKLYQYKGTYTGDNSSVGAIIHALNYTDLPFKSFELKTESEPYGIIVNYQVDSRANYRLQAYDTVEQGWDRNAAVMFSLIPNAGEISFRLYDQYGDFAGAYYNRENLSERFGMEYFTDDIVKEAAAGQASFTNYLDKVAAIRNPEDFYSEGQKQSMEQAKQIYNLIGNDREITPNSGVIFAVTITDDLAQNPPVQELADQKELFAQYSGQKAEFILYHINNFKTNEGTFYIFVFDGTKLIASADLQTAAAEQKAIKSLSALQH